MINPSTDDESWFSSKDPDIEDIERGVILTAESLESIDVDYDFMDDDLVDDEDGDFLIDEFYRAADETLRIVDASEIWAGYGLDERELAQLAGKP